MKLLALRCPQCDTWLQPQQLDVVLPCPTCRTAVSLQETGLTTLPITYVAPEKEGATVWLPFWHFQGRVHIERRDTQGGGRSSQRDAEELWGQPRHFYVPAWDLPTHRAREMGGRFVSRQPTLKIFEPTEPPLFQAAVLTPDDAQKLLELIILTIEADRSDWLKNLQFHLELAPPELWAMPARSKRDDWDLIPALA
ncbi:MAG: hypothetical protein H6664_15280 [Ardenticatenaceae bacterium]|nr:hypothetical protein [Ardenticatenaceae bacterium]